MKNYFPHDHHARSDKKLINLIRVMGLAGLGLYWCIIEMLYEESGWLQTSDLESIAYDLRTDTKTINSLVNNFDLFFIDGEKFSSKAVLSRLKLIESKSSQASKAARLRWQKCKEDANAMQTHSDRNAIKEIKTNEIKLNESKTENNASLPLFKEENSEMDLGSMQPGNDPDGTPLLERTDLKAEPEKPKEKSSAKKEKGARPWADLISFEDNDTPELRAKWQEWIEYKKLIGSSYKTQNGEQAELNKIKKYPLQFALYTIQLAIDKEWQGVVNRGTPDDYQAYANNPAAFLASKSNPHSIQALQTNGQPTYTNRQQSNGAGPDLETAVAMSRLIVGNGYKQAG